MMNAPEIGVLRREVFKVLDEIKDPCSVAASVAMGLDEMGIIKSVHISDAGHVAVEFRLTSPFCEMIAYMTNEALAKVGALPGVMGVSISNDTGLDWDPDMIAPEAQARRRRRLAMLHDLTHMRRNPPAPAREPV